MPQLKYPAAARFKVPAKYALPVVVAPPEMVRPPACVPSPMVEDAVTRRFLSCVRPLLKTVSSSVARLSVMMTDLVAASWSAPCTFKLLPVVLTTPTPRPPVM